MTYPSPKRNMVLKAILMKSGLVSLTTARSVNTAQPRTTVNSARPMTNAFNKAHSTVRRPINNNTTFKNNNFNQRVNTVKDKNVNAGRPKAVVNTARPKAILNVVKGNQVNAIKASACWVWKPKNKVIDHGNPQQDLEEKCVIDSGCSRHMTGNMSYLTDFEEIYGGYLTDESHVLLKVPKKNNMYSVDLKNIVPKGGLTCLFAKATSNESKLWHRRLGHINFKTMNKLVKGNLLRATKDETSGILKSFITGVENLIDQWVKVIRCDNGTEFKNKEMNQFCERKSIKREFSVARTPQQNRVAERKNRTLIEAAMTMLADSKLPTTFWAEVVNTTCYVQNKVLVTKPHNKTPFDLFLDRKPALGFMKPFGCPFIILNTIDHLGKFDGKANEGFFVGYSINSKAFRVFNSRTRIVKENLHVQFSENTPNIAGSGPNWIFDIDALTKSMNYKPVVAGNQSNGNENPKACDDAGDEKKVTEEPGKEGGDPRKDSEGIDQEKEDSTNNVDAASTNEVNAVGAKTSIKLLVDLDMPELGDIVYLDNDEDVGAEADMNNLDTFMPISPILTKRVHKDHPVEKIIGDLSLVPQTRRMTKNLEERGLFSLVQQRTNHKDFQNCLFACFLSQEPKKVIHALKDPSWIEAMHEELLQFKLQEVWTLVDLPNGKRAIGTKWVFRNKKDERGIMIKNKARLFAQEYTQEEGIDYDEVFALVARIEAIRLFLAYASFKDFMVYQMDVKSAFLYGKIEEELYVYQPSGFEDPDLPDRVYKVEKALYGMHQAPRAWYETLSTYLLDNGFQREKIDKTLFIRRDKGDILFTDVKTASTPMETQKPLLKDEDGEEVDVYMYRSMIGSLMYLTSSRPDIMFVVCACARYQVNPKVSHLYDVKRIFREGCLDWNGKAAKDEIGNGIGVNTDNSKLMLLGINLLLLLKVNAVRHKLTTVVEMDGKKIVITESTIRRDLQLEDAKGIDCLPNATIFKQLTLMGYEKLSHKLTFYKPFFSPQWKFLIHTILQCLSAKTTAWNEFSSTIASAIICFATNQKFNFLKYILKSMVKNLENVSGKFLMYPRFVQVIVNKQVGDMSNNKRIYVTPSHTKKVFGNMKREGKGFSRRATPLFPTMMVQAQEEMGEGLANPTDPHHTPIITQPSTSQPQKKQKPRKPKRKDTKVPQPSGPITNVADEAVNKENVSKHSNDPLLSGEDNIQLKELIDFFKNLEKKEGLRTHKLKRLYKVGLSRRVESSNEASLGDQKDASKQGRKIDDINKDAEVILVDETQGMYGDDQMFDVSDLAGKAVFVAEQGVPDSKKDDVVSTAAKPKVKGIFFKEPVETTTTKTTISLQQPSQATVQDKGKGKMVEPKHVKKFLKRDQIRLDEELAFKLQAEEEEEERLAREKVKANVALIEEWNDIQAKIEADQLLAERLQAREQEELTIKERAKLFQ
ncbi:putative ribonuclease H-like domain-containing protein [Tanacetum coccineum]